MKYIIKRIPVLPGWVFVNYEYKTVSKNELPKYIKENWVIDRKEYIIISDLIKFWNSYDRNKKTDIILVILSSLLGYILGKL